MADEDSAVTATGAREIVRFLEDHGQEHVFGLPGSSMVSVLYELQNSKIQYVPTIHESVTVAAADGYARVRGLGVAMIYMLPGTANAMANLYNAWWDESPLLLMASQQASTYRTRGSDGTVCEGDTVRMTRPYTRMSHELTRDTPVRPWLEAARRAAIGSPSGPAFLSICEDVYEGKAPVVDVRMSVRHPSCPSDMSAVIDALTRAERPLIVVGGQTRRLGGAEIVEEISDRFEIPVAYEGGFQGQLGVGPGRERTAGMLAGRGTPFEQDADVVVVIGAQLMIEGHPRPTPWFPNASFVAQVHADPDRLEKTETADWTAVADAGAFARALLAGLSADPPSAELMASRAERLRRLMAQGRRSAPKPDTATGRAFANYAKAAEFLHDVLDHGWMVDESVMSASLLVDALTSLDGSRYVAATGASLGWATGAAAGVAIASGEPVTCVLGDGSLRFGAHGLWTIAALNLPITLVILDNGGYGSTRYFEREYIARLGIDTNSHKPSYLNMDMRTLGPRVGSIIRGFDIPCRELGPSDNVREALQEAWQTRSQGPNAVVIPTGYEDE
ncbi:thiamine pyrophosphate-binding protein [Novosphingobium pentaromativorans]|uniref:Thiamine pyrophosphate-binding protein n=1 Tax=Novosphingobium pentaromativorans US6-1 TaxID=1088721 RepID=G6EGH0_9SPHN|nr:thiamine pyrophosphate-binding protein [Novosphingobium pentaromativorans]AIT82112.1 hypothetical protein JI59_21500 [Novosphingobium pentaromativorans US6-1]EHJ59621.1 hypothetical protein NSU_3504 [Novosphingobium pentaromativorans US6-1]